MGKLTDFIREYWDIKREKADHCKTCDILREELAQERREKRALLDKFIFISSTPIEVPATTPKPIISNVSNWRIQRQILEAEDRAKAAAIRKQQEEEEFAKKIAQVDKSKPVEDSSISIDQLEKELAIGGEQ